MLERKNIDRVFQENLKDLEIYPSKKVWNNIEQTLNNKPKKNTIVLWQRLSGVAMIIIFFLAGGIMFYNSNQNIPIESEVSDSNSNNIIEEVQLPVIQNNNETESIIAQYQKKKIISHDKEKHIFVKKPNNNIIITSADISSIYTTIENKYVIDQIDFIDELNSDDDLVVANDFLLENVEKSNSKKWSVGPTVAPIYYNTLQSGSPLNANLSQNSKSSDNAFSVGVKVNYQLSNKVFLQSGLNKVELAYNTSDVTAHISTVKNAYNNINTNKPGVTLTPIRNNNSLTSTQSNLNKSNIDGELNQSIEYFEFPLELKYNLYDKKVGLNIVGGFSTLILSNNTVSIISQNSVTDLGEANNLNELNFSGNFGIDLDYKINNSWYLNVAPMFKYQFNTYSNNSGNFKPYYFGVYSGLNYKF